MRFCMNKEHQTSTDISIIDITTADPVVFHFIVMYFPISRFPNNIISKLSLQLCNRLKMIIFLTLKVSLLIEDGNYFITLMHVTTYYSGLQGESLSNHKMVQLLHKKAQLYDIIR